jgi:hypothetical protein
MSHSIQAIIGSKTALEAIQQRLATSRVIALNQGLFLLPVTEELYDALPEPAETTAELFAGCSFEFMRPKIAQFLLDIAHSERIAYVETDYFGGEGDQGAFVVEGGEMIFEPESGHGTINSVLRRLGATRGDSADAFEAVGLDRFRSNDDWLEQGG